MNVDELHTTAPKNLGVTAWRTVSQEQITGFADVTGDQQWIHADPARAADGPFGSTIAHGYLLLSLVPQMVDEVLVVEDRRMGVNYGVNRLRFTGTVVAGSRVRGRVVLARGDRRADGAILLTLHFTLERESHDAPALVAELLSLVYGAP